MGRLRAVTGLFLVLLALVAMVVPVGAQAGEPEVVIVEVDTTRYPEDGKVTMVAELRNVDGFDPETLILTENGVVVDEFTVDTIEQSVVDVGVVLAIDVSGSMEGEPLEAAKAAAIAFVNQKNERDAIALVTFGDEVNVLVDFTTNARAINSQIAGLTEGGNTALYDAMVKSANLYAGSGAGLQPHIIVLTDGTDEGSITALEDAIEAVTRNEARVFAVGLESDRLESEPLQEMADSSRGLYLEATNPDDLENVYGQIRRELNNKIVIRFSASQERAGVASFGLEYQGLRDGQNAEVPGFIIPERLAPTVTTLPSFEAAPGETVESTLPTSITTLKILAAGGVSLGMLLLFYILFGVMSDDDNRLTSRLRAFERVPALTESGGGTSGLLKHLPFFGRLSSGAEEAARKRGVLFTIDSMLDQANISLRAGEAIASAFLIAVVIGAIVGGVTRSVLIGAVVAGLAILVVFAVLGQIADRERKRFEEQLPDTLTLLSTSLRAGYSLLQAVEAVKEEAPNPTGREFSRAIVEIRLGRQVVDALQGVAERTRSQDFEWTVMAIEIQREVGGNLSEVLNTVAETMRSRNRLRGEVRALTAEGRISMIIMVLLPFVVLAAVYVLNRPYLLPLIETRAGLYAVGFGAVTMVIGVLWMRKIVDIQL